MYFFFTETETFQICFDDILNLCCLENGDYLSLNPDKSIEGKSVTYMSVCLYLQDLTVTLETNFRSKILGTHNFSSSGEALAVYLVKLSS